MLYFLRGYFEGKFMLDRKVWGLQDPEEGSISGGMEAEARAFVDPQRDPSLAFSLSLILWGGGQFYNFQRKLGLLLFLLMANFYLFLILGLMNREAIVTSLQSVHVSQTGFFLASGIFYTTGLIIWIGNALHAYWIAAKTHFDPSRGIQNPILPAFCSFLVPGWGQILNGQSRKAGFFLISTFLAWIVIPVFLVIPQVWPTLELSSDRFFLEKVLTFALVISPFLLLVWIINIYDALRVGLDPLKKEPLKKRLAYSYKRARMKGWFHRLVPQLKVTLMLALFLILSLTVGYYSFSKNAYIDFVQNINHSLSQQEMILIPHLIQHYLLKNESNDNTRRKELPDRNSSSPISEL
jgi:hypothetical protein